MAAGMPGGSQHSRPRLLVRLRSSFTQQTRETMLAPRPLAGKLEERTHRKIGKLGSQPWLPAVHRTGKAT